VAATGTFILEALSVCVERLPFSRAGHNAPMPAWLKAGVTRVGCNGLFK
jgi:hypothetical protein